MTDLFRLCLLDITYNIHLCVVLVAVPRHPIKRARVSHPQVEGCLWRTKLVAHVQHAVKLSSVCNLNTAYVLFLNFFLRQGPDSLLLRVVKHELAPNGPVYDGWLLSVLTIQLVSLNEQLHAAIAINGVGLEEPSKTRWRQGGVVSK